MPELPEVETFRRRFRDGDQDSPSLIGRRILDAVVFWDRTVAELTPAVFKDRIKGQVIEDIGRRGKYLLFCLSEDTLAIHLRMSGDLWLDDAEDPPGVHYRLTLSLDDGEWLVFNDIRKFGRVWLTSDVDSLLSHLGPEPLDAEFRPEVLFEMLQKRKRQIKPLLLDQSFLAGMGNIYTDEALFYAGIHPKTPADQIPCKQVKRLWEGIQNVLREGIRRNGASIDWVYRGGDFQNYFQVYGRAGESCYRCETPVERLVVGQRSTHICPSCQLLNLGQE